MEFCVLESTGADDERWRALVERLPPHVRDMHFLPEYVRIYEKAQGVVGRLAYLGAGDDVVIQAFVVRPLDGLPFLAGSAGQERHFDIASVYGYGGPISNVLPLADAAWLFREFDRHFVAYCRGERFASEFCCLHPLLENHKLAVHSSSIAIKLEKSVVTLDLTLSDAEMWSQLSKGHRSGISKARRNGVRIVQVPPDEANLEIFARLYAATMNRHHAAQKWHLPTAHFADCVAELGPRRVALFLAEADDGVAAAAFVLHDEKVAYYHYAGSDEKHFPLRPTNCMVYEIALWAKGAGMRCFHLGGGLTETKKDTLMLFKSGFSAQRRDLYVYGRVLDETVYETLADLRREFAEAAGAQMTNPAYFPFYRG